MPSDFTRTIPAGAHYIGPPTVSIWEMITQTGELTPEEMQITCQPSTQDSIPCTRPNPRLTDDQRPNTRRSNDPQPWGYPLPETDYKDCCAPLSQSTQRDPFYHQDANQIVETCGCIPDVPGRPQSTTLQRLAAQQQQWEYPHTCAWRVLAMLRQFSFLRASHLSPYIPHISAFAAVACACSSIMSI